MNTNPTAKTILCFGDSNTWGQVPVTRRRHPANVRWTGVLQQALGEAYYVIEEGLCGRTTNLDYPNQPRRNGKTYLEPCLDSHLPVDLVIIMLGTNDLKVEFDRSARQIAEATKDLIELIQAKTKEYTGKAAEVLLVSPVVIDDTALRHYKLYDNYYNHESILKSQQLAAELQTIANATGSHFADAAQVAHAGEDGIHFTPESHHALGELLAQKVREIEPKNA